MSDIRVLSFDEVVTQLRAAPRSYQHNYLAMYSSLLGGVTLEPQLMTVPIDDHIVHRGDGVFEAIKCIDRQVYGMEAHLNRLENSARMVSLPLPFSTQKIGSLICQTIRLAKLSDCLVRLYVSRGPGGFTTNPYESIGSQLYIVLTRLSAIAPEKYQNGVSLATSQVAVKQDIFTNIKSCNYLPNVLMKKEAVDAKVDFTIGVDHDGYLTEGSTENIGFITADNRLLVPRFKRTLKGITVSRVLELAQKWVHTQELHQADVGDITAAEAYRVREILTFGTTIDVLPIVMFDGHPIGDGRPGLWSKRFLELIHTDMKSGVFSTSIDK
jgi:branched-chain amino acid aminotransferase